MTNQTFCPKCGQAITGDVKFCPACGEAISGETGQQPKPKSKSKPKLPILFGALALISGISWIVITVNPIWGETMKYVYSRDSGTSFATFQDFLSVLLVILPILFAVFLVLAAVFFIQQLKNRKK
jgi:uncharacterized BrkB/YihY/UPF0761 family membrane protein